MASLFSLPEALATEARANDHSDLEALLHDDPSAGESAVHKIKDDHNDPNELLRGDDAEIDHDDLEAYLAIGPPDNDLLNPTQMDPQVPTDGEPEPPNPALNFIRRLVPYRPGFVDEYVLRLLHNQSVTQARDRVPEFDTFPPTFQQKGGKRARSGSLNVEGKQKRNERQDITSYFKICTVARYRDVLGMIARSRETHPTLWGKKGQESRVILNYLHLWQASLSEKWRRILIGEVKQLKQWEEQMNDERFSYCATALRLREGTCHEDFKEVDEQLLVWLRKQRADNKRVSWSQLFDKADQIASVEYQKAVAANKETTLKPRVSAGFIYRWRRRHNIVMKKIKKQVTLTDSEVDARLQKFLEHVYRNVQHCDGVINFDEIPMSLSGAMGISRTVTTKEDASVVVNADSNDTKRIATLIPIAGCKRVGDGWQPIHIGTILIFIGTPKQARVLNETYYPGVTVAWTRCGVMTSDLMLSTVVPLIRSRCDQLGVGTCLVVLDSAMSHTTAPVVQALKSQRTPPSVIPGGMTAFVQWVDVFFAAKYRSLHKQQYAKWEGVKKTASQKRRLVAKIVGTVIPSMLLSVVDQFSYLGYLDASNSARIPSRPGFAFEVPSAEVMANDLALFEASIAKAVQEKETREEAERFMNSQLSQATNQNGANTPTTIQAPPATQPAAPTQPTAPAQPARLRGRPKLILSAPPSHSLIHMFARISTTQQAQPETTTDQSPLTEATSMETTATVETQAHSTEVASRMGTVDNEEDVKAINMTVLDANMDDAFVC